MSDPSTAPEIESPKKRATITKVVPEGEAPPADKPRPSPTESEAFSMHCELVTAEADMGPKYPKKLGFKPFKVRDIKTLVYAPDDEYYPEVLVNLIRPLMDFEPLDLTLIDFDKVILFLRVNSCGPTVTYNLVCPDCERVTPRTTDLGKLLITAVSSEYKEPFNTKVGGFVLGLPRMRSRIEWTHWLDVNQKTSTQLDQLVLYIQGGTIEEKVAKLDDASPMVITEIQGFIAKSLKRDWGVQHNYEFICPHPKLVDGEKVDATKTEEAEAGKEGEQPEPCGYTERMLMPFRGEFFLPDDPADREQADSGA